MRRPRRRPVRDLDVIRREVAERKLIRPEWLLRILGELIDHIEDATVERNG